jgi:UDP-4-amino-4,6-dideoxy-N-acetyl-beta-L-altrosamine transaminase
LAAFLPYGRQLIEDDDIAAVVEVLRGDTLTTGPATESFDRLLAETVGAGHGVSCANGTAALHLAALALGLGPGDWVAVPAVTFLATANAARFVGADVLFTDVDPETGLMRPEDLEQALATAGGRRVKAVFPVHLAGQSCAMPELAALARARGLHIVEDASHALGTSYGEGARRIGGCAHSDMATFSFHPVKTVAMGEGGGVTTNDAALAARLKRLRSHGMTRVPEQFANPELAFDAEGNANPWYYEMAELGFNYRASDIHCALGLSQLRKLPRFIQRRRAVAERYDALLAPLAPLVRPTARQPGCNAAWHLYVTLIDFAAAGTTRAKVMRDLREHGIGTQVHYIPVCRQPYYQGLYGDQRLPGADAYYDRCLSLPLFAAMAPQDAERVVAAMKEVLF